MDHRTQCTPSRSGARCRWVTPPHARPPLLLHRGILARRRIRARVADYQERKFFFRSESLRRSAIVREEQQEWAAQWHSDLHPVAAASKPTERPFHVAHPLHDLSKAVQCVAEHVHPAVIDPVKQMQKSQARMYVPCPVLRALC